jgi:formylglycine-generating enzyme required for sulfatase activity
MYCRSCDVEYPGALRFCKWCGGNLVEKDAIGSQHCPACGVKVERDWLFCNECGVDLATLGAQPKEQTCPSCSASVRKGWMFCRQCGEQIATERATKKCAVCGAGMREAWSFCKHCGAGKDGVARPKRDEFATIASMPAIGSEPDKDEPFSGLASGDLPPLDDVLTDDRRRRQAQQPPARKAPPPSGTKPLTTSRTTGQLDERSLRLEYSDYASEKPSGGAVKAEDFELRTVAMNAVPDLPTYTPDSVTETLPADPPDPPEASGGGYVQTVAMHAVPDISAFKTNEEDTRAADSSPTIAMSAVPDVAAFETNEEVARPPAPAQTIATFAVPPPAAFTTEETPTPSDQTVAMHAAPSHPSFRPTTPPAMPAAPSYAEAPPTVMLPPDHTTSQPPPFSTVAPVQPKASPAMPVAKPAEPAAVQSAAGGSGIGVKIAIAALVVLVLLGGAGTAIIVLWDRLVPSTSTPPAEPAQTPITSSDTPPDKTPAGPAVPDGMVLVPAGSFTLGGDSAEIDEFSRPGRRVDVKAFYIDKTEVTNAQYKVFVDKTGALPPTEDWTGNEPNPGTENMPVRGITWEEATAYAKWAGKRLPTEIEWEYAARGPESRLFPWGADWSTAKANVGAPEAPPSRKAVGSHPEGASFCGALDMCGNVWEYTSSDFSLYPGSTVVKEVAAAGSGKKVIRGGAWNSQSKINMAYRGYTSPNTKEGHDKTGFRCVKDL